MYHQPSLRGRTASCFWLALLRLRAFAFGREVVQVAPPRSRKYTCIGRSGMHSNFIGWRHCASGKVAIKRGLVDVWRLKCSEQLLGRKATLNLSTLQTTHHDDLTPSCLSPCGHESFCLETHVRQNRRQPGSAPLRDSAEWRSQDRSSLIHDCPQPPSSASLSVN